MIEKLSDPRISPENQFQFNKRGWTLVDLNLTDELIQISLKGLEEMKAKSIENEYKPRRIYYDHLFHKNPSAIELPFNKSICNEKVKYFFKQAKIGLLVKTLMNWENPCCDLARLFCMGDYKYRGNWHRDYIDDLDNIHCLSNKRKIVLVGIYLLPQKGFRLLKKEFDYKGKNSIIKNKIIDKSIRSFPFPLSPPKESFDEIDGQVGKALLFDPLIIHQGSNYHSRLDFHMKFFNSEANENKKNDFQDFSIIDILHEDFKIPLGSNATKNFIKFNNIPFDNRSSFVNRISNSIDYRTCLRRLLKIQSLKANASYKSLQNNGWKIDFFANTIFQE